MSCPSVALTPVQHLSFKPFKITVVYSPDYPAVQVLELHYWAGHGLEEACPCTLALRGSGLVSR
jgi:hypothetical protein